MRLAGNVEVTGLSYGLKLQAGHVNDRIGVRTEDLCLSLRLCAVGQHFSLHAAAGRSDLRYA